MEKLFWYITADGAQWGPFTYEESIAIDDTPNPDGEHFRWKELTPEEYANVTRDEFTLGEIDAIKKAHEFVKVG